MSNEVMTRNSEWMNHIVNHLNRMVDNFERAVMNYRPMLGGERFMTDTNQIRMKIGVTGYGSPETTTGGNALKF